MMSYIILETGYKRNTFHSVLFFFLTFPLGAIVSILEKSILCVVMVLHRKAVPESVCGGG